MNHEAMDDSDRHRFSRRVLALSSVLCIWTATLYYLHSTDAWRTAFREEPIVADLSTPLEANRTITGSLLLTGSAATVSMPLTNEPLRTGSDYLVNLRAAAGLAFDLQVMDRATGLPAWRFRLPLRAQPETYRLRVPAGGVPPSNRLQISSRGGRDVEVLALSVQALHPIQRWVIPISALTGAALFLLFLVGNRRRLFDYLRFETDEKPVREERAWDRLMMVFVLIACFLVFSAAPVNQLLDARFSTVVSHQIMTKGTLALPPGFVHASGDTLPYMLQEVDGSILHFYPQALALLNVPFVAAFELVGIKPVTADGFFLRHNENRILRFAAAVQAALLCVLLFSLGRLFLRPSQALPLVALFAFGTQIFSSVSRPYWSHAWAMLLLTGGLYVLLRRQNGSRRWSLVLAASLLSWSFFCRPPMSLSIIGITALLLAKRVKHLQVFIATGAAWAGLFVLYSMSIFDSPIPPYFLTSHLESGVLGFEALQSNYLEALAGTIVSPGRGLFVYVPVTAIILFAVLRYWSLLREKALVATALVVILADWQLISASRVWWGGQSFGPRLFADVLIWFFLLAALALSDLGPTLKQVARAERFGILAAITLAVAASLVINVRGATVRETIQWRGFSFWDWQHPQFLGMPAREQPATIGERLAELMTFRNPGERQRLLQAILENDSVERRVLGGTGMIATEVTHDRWTRGSKPAGLVVTNSTDAPVTPILSLATWAERQDYPILVFVDDGERKGTYRFDRRSIRTIELTPQRSRSSRLYIIWTDKAWTQGNDRRWLGVQLRPPE